MTTTETVLMRNQKKNKENYRESPEFFFGKRKENYIMGIEDL